MPATNMAMVPYLVAIVYLSTFVQYSDFIFSSHSQLNCGGDITVNLLRLTIVCMSKEFDVVQRKMVFVKFSEILYNIT